MGNNAEGATGRCKSWVYLNGPSLSKQFLGSPLWLALYRAHPFRSSGNSRTDRQKKKPGHEPHCCEPQRR